MQLVAEVFHRAALRLQHDRRVVIRQLALRFRVTERGVSKSVTIGGPGCKVIKKKNLHSLKLQVLPHLLQQVVKVPLVVGRNGNGVRDFVDNVELFNADLV